MAEAKAAKDIGERTRSKPQCTVTARHPHGI
jgi:hypothetical protein